MRRKLRAGDLVQVKSAEEILATLDASGCLNKMPFMPEMLAFTGKRIRVAKRAHKTCDTINQTGGRRLADCVHLEDARCDGSDHGDCHAMCLLFWKDAWLTRVSDARKVDSDLTDWTAAESVSRERLREFLEATTCRMDPNDGEAIYQCQATNLYDATTLLKWWDLRQYLQDLTSGNISASRMVRVWFFHGLHKLMGWGVGYRLWRNIYDRLQLKSGGHIYPYKSGKLPVGTNTPRVDLNLQVGESVRVKSHDEIVETLNRAKQNRGMGFGEELVPYCGNTYNVVRRVDRIINEKTGRMMKMGTPSVILDGVVCRSEFSNCRLFCPRAIPSYWREIWLERVDPAAHEN